MLYACCPDKRQWCKSTVAVITVLKSAGRNDRQE